MLSNRRLYLYFYFILIPVWSIFSVVLVSGVQYRDSTVLDMLIAHHDKSSV